MTSLVLLFIFLIFIEGDYCLMKETNQVTLKKAKRIPIQIILILILLFIFLISFSVGRYSVTPKELIYIFYAKITGIPKTWSDNIESVIFQIRLPRIIAALIIGASLSVSGASYQCLFKNPMVSSDILGASAGAGFGAAIALLLSFNMAGVEFLAFVFGMGAVFATYIISKIIGRGNSTTLILVLTGIVISSLFQSLISLIKYVADPDSKLPAITFWLMGGISNITANEIYLLLASFIIGIIPILLLRWKLNILAFGDEEAKSLGINVDRMRVILIFCSTLLTASSVAMAGMVGWVGLVIPHVTRLIVGPNYKTLIPSSVIIGASYLLLIDDISRTIFPMEIPLGILTSLIGAPFFLSILLKARKNSI